MALVRRDFVERWVAVYEEVWRTPGTARLAELFTPDVVYSPSPWAEPVRGLPALAAFWETERDGADEAFTMAAELVALDADTAVVRVAVDYGDEERPGERWRDLWVLRFAAGGRCARFEEWPFAPGQRHGHEEGGAG
ncbi:MAG TPA: nuclear transport factor 2 family protein [Acidimicrobiales bacterium]|nr:nuclear transport factor 2 family protein [Acidimicrobiales bacterium]